MLTINRLQQAPALEDFLDMEPNGEITRGLGRVEGFIQRQPTDGAPATERTVVYTGYDEKNIYFIFLCYDREPGKIRARRMPREQTGADDRVEVLLDTFNDQRRAYLFQSNPLGIQYDALWAEGQGDDGSFDTLWHSEGRVTPKGYVVWMAIPFRSLRFPATREQRWGVVFRRVIPRADEEAFWPHVSLRVEGRLNQAGTLSGLEAISPGRNIQLIPYGTFRSFRALDTREASRPRFREDEEGDAGLDAKFVLKDSLVLDVTLNPDFAQVESDEPQTTVNQRFEVFFPEKRPFFIENASFFDTPINLLFTRRIADPQFGARLTGKAGPYAIGAFLIDDQSPGKAVPPGDPLEDKRALFGIVRVNRDIFEQSTVGFIYTDREFEDSYNRVGGVDGRLKLGENWVAEFQGVTSWTRFLDGTTVAGPAYDVFVRRSGRSLTLIGEYNDRGRNFFTEPGFLRRNDIRRYFGFGRYLFWPEGGRVISWGPEFRYERVHDHSGRRLDYEGNAVFQMEFVGQTEFAAFYTMARERLRAKDLGVFGTLESLIPAAGLDFPRSGYGIAFESSFFPWLSVDAFAGWGQGINFAPANGQAPFRADENQAILELTLRPVAPLRIDNTYLLFRLKDRETGSNIFNNHIVRSKWNYQFTRELSLRVILQYDATLANEGAGLTSLRTRKNFNADVLLTYLLHPGTALFVGYNGNAQNLELSPTPTGAEILRPRNRFVNDARQFFIKFSYLIRF